MTMPRRGPQGPFRGRIVAFDAASYAGRVAIDLEVWPFRATCCNHDLVVDSVVSVYLDHRDRVFAIRRPKEEK